MRHSLTPTRRRPGRLLVALAISAGLIGVVVPLYLAECLGASNRGKGTGIFQWLLTLGIVAAALIAMWFSFSVDEVTKNKGTAEQILAVKDGTVRLAFNVREGVCGDGKTFIRDRTKGENNFYSFESTFVRGRNWRDRR